MMAVQETKNTMHRAKEAIDELFGDGYTSKHPELLAAFITSACTYETCIGAGMVEELSATIHSLAEAIREGSRARCSGDEDIS